MSIRARYALLLALAVLMTLATSYLAVANLARVSSAAGAIADVFLPSVEKILNADRDFYQIYVAELELFDAAPGSREWDSWSREIADNYQQVTERVDAYARLARTDEQRAALAAHVAARERWKAALDRYVALLQEGTPEARQQALAARRELDALFAAAREPLDALTEASLRMAGEARENAAATYSGARRVSLVLVVGGTLLLFFLAALFSRALGAPLAAVVGELDALSRGDFTRPVPEKYLRRRDELGKLFQAMGRVQAGLRPLLAGLKSDAKTLAGNSEALSAASEEIAASSGEVARAIQQVASGASDQAGHLQEILGLIQDITTSLERVYKELCRVRETSAETSRLAGAGKKELDDLVASIEGVREAFKVVAERLEVLKGSVGQVEEILDVINGIADQTNLLALNAAIEAARAGEAGRGFAVVADEVRKLAEESRASSDRIRALLNSITSETNQVVATSEEVAQKVAGQLENVEKTIKAFDDILDSVAAISPMIEATYREVDSTAKAKDVVLERVQSISAVAQETSASAEEISASAEELSASTEEIATGAQQVLEVAKRLEEQVERFKV